MSRQRRRLDRRELEVALERGCVVHGLKSAEVAAVHLVVANGRWLSRGEFRSLVEVYEDPVDGVSAWVDWAQVALECDRSAASSGEVSVLRLACQLAGQLPANPGEDWSLGEILVGLDPVNAMLASRATAMAALGTTVVRSLR